MDIGFDITTCRNVDAAINLEWLAANGLGGYASGTVLGANTRKYHGYLVVAAKPPVERYVMLSRVEERVVIGDKAYEISTNEFSDVIHPLGYKYLTSFEMQAGPVWRFQLGSVELEKTITLVHGQDTVVITYRIKGDLPANTPVKLQIQPMLAGRDFHHTIQINHRPSWNVKESEQEQDTLLLWAQECPVKLALTHNADRFIPGACWWYNFIFRQERMRGYPDREDLWTPGVLEFSLTGNDYAGLICSTKPIPFRRHGELVAQANARRGEQKETFHSTEPHDEFLAQLAVAADQFIVRRGMAGTTGGNQTTIIAGYPWFEDWGRDTFISLPGVALVTNRYHVAKSILVTFADHIKNGLLPNRFPDKGTQPDYNTVDAAMWFVHAAYAYWRYSSDAGLLRDYLYRPLCEIMEKYRDGTDFGIRMDTDALIRAGEPNMQLTWMDAKVGDWVVTPRIGKPVEINALWYSNLKIMALLADMAEDSQRAEMFEGLAQRAKTSFAAKFWNEATQCLFDCIDDQGRGDPAIRPNQVMAVSLPFSALAEDRQLKIMTTVQRQLLTPLGLRTLAPGSLGYHGRYAGDQLARDMAYHQGTVWPWLMGPFVTAYVKVQGKTPQSRQAARDFLSSFATNIFSSGVGSISEIADGDAPFMPRGCIAQAWSVGEVLRAYWEDVLDRAPPWPHETAESSWKNSNRAAPAVSR